ncbi:helix-turn-helix domain-containing protein [Streptomyces kaniharaensis]|uniref:Helix-turn-helix domain-containing protein n=1 Tax=Streptomyces kaniharaensis TaxID=212423 RepID=A0A6N7KT27_9ACTN|nr:helix-turn-helix transcriptional regulator [Streptomyces kaniharaensis]MQS13955.1 helix-turn-helix domain-containing protein [Streptomyces kaniharaensis]
MPVNRNPTVRQRRLARTLKEMRVAAGMTIAQSARQLACAESKISRIEAAQSGIRIVDLRLLLDLYGVTDQATRSQLEDLSRDGRLRGWWDRYSDTLSPLYADYISLEADASDAYSVETFLIPGLLQTEDYTRAVVRAQIEDASVEQVERLTKVRLERRSVLKRQSPLRLWVVLSESVLKHQIGGRAVMREQLDYLVAMADRPNINIQVLPENSDVHAALFGPLVILSFPESTETDVVYVDGLLSTLYIEEPGEVFKYSNLFRRALAESLPRKESIALIERIAKGKHSDE